ncbi:hypothetical protein ACQ4PT_066133 [Festuca glaucescens]
MVYGSARLTEKQDRIEIERVEKHIFLLLDSPANLARACAASPTFRRVITDPYFLRRFHALHPPPLLGIVSSDVFLPAEPQHPSAAAASELIKNGGIDFTCGSVLPSAGQWQFCDSREGRVLLSGDPRPEGSCCGSHRALGRPLAVCDPLHQRYLVLPAIPEDLATFVDHGEHLEDFTAFLAPPAKDEQDNSFLSLPFRVMCVAQCATKLVLFVFFSRGARSGQQWRVSTFEDWGALSESNYMMEGNYRHLTTAQRSYVHGCFYWPIYPRRKKVLVLDARESMPRFSMVDFPLRVHMSSFLVEAAGEQERLAVVSLYRNTDTDEYHLEFDLLENDNEDRWEPEGILFLPLRYVKSCKNNW